RFAAKVGGGPHDRVVEGLAGERVVRQGYGDVAQPCGQLALVSRRVEPQRLDVPKQGDLPLQLSSCPTELDGLWEEIREQAVPPPPPLDARSPGRKPAIAAGPGVSCARPAGPRTRVVRLAG